MPLFTQLTIRWPRGAGRGATGAGERRHQFLPHPNLSNASNTTEANQMAVLTASPPTTSDPVSIQIIEPSKDTTDTNFHQIHLSNFIVQVNKICGNLEEKNNPESSLLRILTILGKFHCFCLWLGCILSCLAFLHIPFTCRQGDLCSSNMYVKLMRTEKLGSL